MKNLLYWGAGLLKKGFRSTPYAACMLHLAESEYVSYFSTRLEPVATRRVIDSVSIWTVWNNVEARSSTS